MILNFIIWDVSPEIFSIASDIPYIGGLSVRWYGLLFAMSFIFGYIIMKKMFANEGLGEKILDQLSTYMLVSTIVGARLGHCLFYEPSYYLSHPFEILKVWEGGLASHGAAVGIFIGLYIFARTNKKPVLWIFDRVAIIVALSGFFIRTGNLMNSEIFGDITNLPWGFIFTRYYDPMLAIDPRHPTQIYEALSYLAIFIFLYRFYWKQKGKTNNGEIFGYFMILLFGVRFLIEFIKVPQVGFEETMVLNMGQILSIPLILAGFIFLWLAKKNKRQESR